MSLAACSISECTRQVRARGLCGAHYQRLRRYGDPEGRDLRSAPLVDRFWARVTKTPTCWNWTGARSSGGYGQLGSDGKVIYTHRLSYELHVGPIPEGLVIDHLCRNRACCNPQHLEAVTGPENTRRGKRDQTECVNGHSYIEGDHLYVRPDGGGRQCRTCSNDKRRALRAAS